MDIDESYHEIALNSDIEIKFVDYILSATAFTDVWASGEMDPTENSISGIAQGDGDSERDGRVSTLLSWHLKGFIEITRVESQVNPTDDEICRIVVVLDTQTNGAQLNAENVFISFAAAKDVSSMRSLPGDQRFQILHDKTILIPAARAVMNEGAADLFARGTIRSPFEFEGILNPPIRVNHLGTSTAIASIADNSIHVIGVATGTTPEINYVSRIRFVG